MDQPKTLRLADYRRPDFTTDHVDLNFDIHADHTDVTSKVTYKRADTGAGKTELVLNAENPNPKGKPYIKSVTLNGWDMYEGENGYTFDEDNGELRITIDSDEDPLEVEIQTTLEPQHNTQLTGLYKSENTFVTQCESESFRRITPFLDRPDVMAKYTVRIEAPKDLCPVLTANGNKIDGGDLKDDKHFAVYHDPFPKPSYLFCTANGQMDSLNDTYKTKSGRNVALTIYTEKGKTSQAHHAMDALKKSMKFDEDMFDCEYDLDNYGVVAVSKFTFGAMENKGLNVFKDRLVFADPETATDADYANIDRVIGHEYFHNYSGNRVTCANWFNLSLKEGLTVNREQMFTAHLTSKALDRIKTVQTLRGHQFPEDDSPLAHPVMPQEVQSVENCYSGTIYEKGSEVIRMMKTMMGDDQFIAGVKHYFKTNDGQAVTINEFVKSMETVSGIDLSHQFSDWYTQSGRPRVKANGVYDPNGKTYTITLEQETPPTADQPHKKPMVIPVVMGLIGKDGKPMKLALSTDAANPQNAATERTIILKDQKQSFVFTNVNDAPAFHSIFRDFSAPVDYDSSLSEMQLNAQLLHDTDGFCRWDAGQKLALNEMVRLYQSMESTSTMPTVKPEYIATLKTLVNDRATDSALLARTLDMPSASELENRIGQSNPATIAAVQKHLKTEIASALENDLVKLFDDHNDKTPYQYDYAQVGRRSLLGTALSYLSASNDPAKNIRAKAVYDATDNMTNRMAALSALKNHAVPERDTALTDFLARYKNDSLTVQKYFTVRAMADEDNVIDDLKAVMNEPYFDWKIPDHGIRVAGGLVAGYNQFHRADGKGYDFVADTVIKMDALNPMIASRLVEPLCNWGKYTSNHQTMMIEALQRIADERGADISVPLKERLVKSLPQQAAPKIAASFNAAPVTPAP